MSPRLRLPVAALALAAAFMGGACTRSPGYGLKPPTKVDVAELAPVSLQIEVQNFRWAYSDAGDRLNVFGQVKNKTGRTQQPVFLYAMLFDETGLAVGMGEARVNPDSLFAGAEGRFNLAVKTSRPRLGRKGPIRHLRLLTNARNE